MTSAYSVPPAPVKSVIHQQIEISNGTFIYQISCDGAFVKIARKGGAVNRAGFFLMPMEFWDEIVNFVYTEGKRRQDEQKD